MQKYGMKLIDIVNILKKIVLLLMLIYHYTAKIYVAANIHFT